VTLGKGNLFSTNRRMGYQGRGILVRRTYLLFEKGCNKGKDQRGDPLTHNRRQRGSAQACLFRGGIGKRKTMTTKKPFES